MTRSAELAKGTVACVMLFAAQGCGPDFGKDTAKNEKDIKIVVERFLAESDSASSGNKQQIADRLAAMRSLQIDMKEIDPTSVCTKFQTDSLAVMTKVIDKWEGVGSASYEAEQVLAAMMAVTEAGNLIYLNHDGCSVDSAKTTP